MISYEICCLQTESHYKKIDRITNQYQFLTWHPFTLPLSDCLHTKTLDFIIIIDILKTVNKQQSLKYRVYHNRTRSSLSPYAPPICYKWIIAKHNLSAFRHCPFKMYFCSPNFANNTWFLFCYPRYHEKTPKFIGMFLGLQLLTRPSFVESLYVDITIIQLNGRTKQKIFNYKRKIWNNTRLDFYKCEIDSPLSFIISIKILEVCSIVRHPHITRNQFEITNSNIYR